MHSVWMLPQSRLWQSREGVRPVRGGGGDLMALSHWTVASEPSVTWEMEQNLLTLREGVIENTAGAQYPS